jgi:hypothetical protein
MCGRRIESYTLAVGWKGSLPKAMLDVFFFLDSFYGKMEAQEAKKEAEKNAKRQKR